jgi:hypothetical protein
MPIDTRRVILAAVEAALKDEDPSSKTKHKKRGLPAGRALLLGAGLMTAGRLAVGSRGREVMGSLQERLSDFEARYLGDDDQEPELEGDEDFDDDEEFDEDEDYPEDEEYAEDEEFDEADEPVEDEESVASE